MTAAASTPSEFHRALAATLRYAPGYPASSGTMLSNHLPMVLHALHRLGAPAFELDRMLALWRPKLVDVAAHPDADSSPRGQAYAQALKTLVHEATSQGVPGLLQRHVPALLEKPEVAAFHGLIRLGHAIDGGLDGEIVHAVAAWQAGAAGEDEGAADTRVPDGAARGSFDMHRALDAAGRDPGLQMVRRQGTTIVSDMVVAQHLASFESHAAGFAPTIDALAEASLAVHRAADNFTSLHLVTATHALRVLLERVPLQEAVRDIALARHARAWLAAWVSIGRPAPRWDDVHAGHAAESSWNDVLPRLHASTNDHAIKLAYAAREEWRHRGWPGYARCLP